MFSMSMLYDSNNILSAGLGMTGVPVFNVNNNCSSGSTGIMMARYLILAGYDCALAVGKNQAWLQLVMTDSRLQYYYS